MSEKQHITHINSNYESDKIIFEKTNMMHTYISLNNWGWHNNLYDGFVYNEELGEWSLDGVLHISKSQLVTSDLFVGTRTIKNIYLLDIDDQRMLDNYPSASIFFMIEFNEV